MVTIALLTFEQHSRLSTCLQTQVELQSKQVHLNHVLLERKRYIKRTSSYEPCERGWLGFQDLASTLLSSEKFGSVTEIKFSHMNTSAGVTVNNLFVPFLYQFSALL